MSTTIGSCGFTFPVCSTHFLQMIMFAMICGTADSSAVLFDDITHPSCEVVRRFLELHCSIRPALVYRHFVFPTYFNQVQLVPPSGFGVGV